MWLLIWSNKKNFGTIQNVAWKKSGSSAGDRLLTESVKIEQIQTMDLFKLIFSGSAAGSCLLIQYRWISLAERGACLSLKRMPLDWLGNRKCPSVSLKPEKSTHAADLIALVVRCPKTQFVLQGEPARRDRSRLFGLHPATGLWLHLPDSLYLFFFYNFFLNLHFQSTNVCLFCWTDQIFKEWAFFPMRWSWAILPFCLQSEQHFPLRWEIFYRFKADRGCPAHS